MALLIPPLIDKDSDALKKSSNKLVKMAIILIVVLVFKPLVSFLGEVLGFDISCIL